MRLSTTCPSCSVNLKLKSRPASGKRLRCPKCGEPFLPEIDELDDDAKFENEENDPGGGIRRTGPSKRTGRSVSETGHKSAKSKTKSAGLSSVALAGIVSGVVITLGVIIAVCVLMLPGDSNSSAVPNAPENGGPVAGAPVASGGGENVGSPAVETLPTVSSGPQITDAECTAFGDAMEQAIADGDLARANRLLNAEAILDKSTAKVDVDPMAIGAFKRGVLSTFKLASLFIDHHAQPTGSFQFLRIVESDTPRQVMFRFIQQGGAFSYFRFDLIRDSGGQVVAGDIFPLAMGEYYSASFRRLFLPLAANASPGLLDRLFGKEQEMVANMPKLEQMTKALQSDQPARALEVYNTLPQSLKMEPWCLLLRLAAAQQSGNNAEYISALNDTRRATRVAITVDLLSIDYNVLKGNYAEAHACVARVDKALGGDPFLKHVIPAGLLIKQGKLAEARATLTPLIDDKRLGNKVHETMLDICVAERDHPGTLRSLLVLKDCGFKFSNLVGVPIFAEFVKSAEYQQWLKNR